MLQERIKKTVKIIRLPSVFAEEDRGFFECCDPELVLASGSNLSWKNDITPAFIKMYSSTDLVTFTLKKDGVETTFQPDSFFFPNDEFSKYTEVHWKDVLSNEGAGCYSLNVEYEVNGISGSFVWGKYKLLPFSVENAMGTARLRAVFNHFHEIQGIDFKGANVNGTIRFYGFIGNRQPKKEIDNLIYANREIKSVVRENMNSYELKTDDLKEQNTTMITDLYLLSEVELYASDHNRHNHSYKILDIPVTIEESEEMEYRELSRGAKINATLVDKFRNKRTYFS